MPDAVLTDVVAFDNDSFDFHTAHLISDDGIVIDKPDTTSDNSNMDNPRMYD